MRHLIKVFFMLTTLSLFQTSSVLASTDPLNITVYKSPYCGCCKDWVKHIQDNGFNVTVIEQENVNPTKQRLGVEPRLASCHTATINGYVIEGHVPANDIKKMLQQKLDIKGLAVPGMVMGSPGMEDPAGKKFTPFKVVAFRDNGDKFIFSSYRQPLQ
jgi:hypothetical protein